MKLKERYDWSDVTLAQMQEINTLPENMDKLDNMIEQLSILTDTDPFDIKRMPVDDMVKEFEKWSFINEQPQPKENKKIKVNGKNYYLIDLNKMSLGQLVDIEEYASEGVIENAHKILSVLYQPKKNIFSKELKEYEPNKELEEGIKYLTLDVIYPTLLFFYLIVQTYLTVLEASLDKEKEVMKMMEEMELTKEEEKQLEMLKQKLNKELDKSGIG